MQGLEVKDYHSELSLSVARACVCRMTNPLSITVGVLALLGTCVNVGTVLKDIYNGRALADTKVKGLLTNVESFTQVLQFIRDTLEHEQIQTSL